MAGSFLWDKRRNAYIIYIWQNMHVDNIFLYNFNYAFPLQSMAVTILIAFSDRCEDCTKHVVRFQNAWCKYISEKIKIHLFITAGMVLKTH